MLSVDTVAEWLRRWTANPMCSARVGSNPIGVVLFLFDITFLFAGQRIERIILDLWTKYDLDYYANFNLRTHYQESIFRSLQKNGPFNSRMLTCL